jgi:hypothetical protein
MLAREIGPDDGEKLKDRTARRSFAEDIARKHGVDAGDVEHVLSNLVLQPLERLRKSMRRARLRGIALKSSK